MRKTFVLLICFAIVSGSLTAEIDFSSLRRAVFVELDEKDTPGAAVALIQKDRVIFSEPFGFANDEKEIEVTRDTLFQIGSMTKMMTAMVLTSLAEEGKIDLSAPIGNYVKGLNSRIAQLTSHQLLSQTSGLRDMPGEYGTSDELELGKFLRTLREDSLLADPGIAFSYSNLNYALAGLVIQEVAGKPYADVMSERLFKPLGMNRTIFRPGETQKFPVATGYTSPKPKTIEVVPVANDTRLWPAGYAFSTLNDLSRFAIALLNEGKLEGKKVMDPAVVKKVMEPTVAIPTNVFENGKYGYGFFIHQQRFLTVKEHGGNMPGFIAELILVPEKQNAVIVLVNSGNDRFTKSIEAAFSILVPDPPEAKKKEPPKNIPMKADEMSRYAGTYKNRWDMDIFVRDNELFLRRFGDELPITKIAENRFAVYPPGALTPQEFLIIPGKDGKPEYIQMFLWIFKRVPQI
jgi:CubicO group peptidase (beta-lactamase class C family)